MRFLFLVIAIVSFLLPTEVAAQKVSKFKVRKFLKTQIESYAPALFEKNVSLRRISMDDLKIKKRAVIVKGDFKLKKEEGELKNPIQFKSKLSTRSGLGLKYIKVRMPGHSFLGIPIYKKIYP